MAKGTKHYWIGIAGSDAHLWGDQKAGCHGTADGTLVEDTEHATRANHEAHSDKRQESLLTTNASLALSH